MEQYTEVKCPVCGTFLQVPVRQVLDVRVEPNVKGLLFRGLINIVVCPNCGRVLKTNMPFIYHDPEHSAVLLYLPTDAGTNEIERQKVAGRLNQALLNSLPSEEHKSYLLQPETFLSTESLVKRMLELEGLSEEDLHRTEAHFALIRTLIMAMKNGAQEQAVVEHQAEVEEPAFHLFLRTHIVPEGKTLPSEESQILQELLEYLSAHTQTGQKFAQFERAYQVYRNDPSSERLLDFLELVPTEELLYDMLELTEDGLNYAFFEVLLARIEQAPTEKERKKWEALRERILAARDEILKIRKQLFDKRTKLLQRLLNSKEQEKMLHSHLSELDDSFSLAWDAFHTLATQENNSLLLQNLELLKQKMSDILSQDIPPDVLFTQLLLQARTDQEAHRILQNYRSLITPDSVAKTKKVLAELQEHPEGQSPQTLARFAHFLALMEAYLPQNAGEDVPETEAEDSLPQGLIFAKH